MKNFDAEKYEERYIVYHFCEAFEQNDMAVEFVVPFLLLVLTVIYAYFARKCPGKFNENRYIVATTCRCLFGALKRRGKLS